MKKSRWSPDNHLTLPWRIGQILQGTVMGILLVFSVLELIALHSSVTIFQYQGY
jgi:hypothetical protein